MIDREHLELQPDERIPDAKPYRLVANSKRRGCLLLGLLIVWAIL